MRTLYLTKSIVIVLLSFFFTACSDDLNDSIATNNEFSRIAQFEQEYIKSYFDSIQGNENKIRLIGYKTINIQDTKDEYEDLIKSYGNEIDQLKSIYFSEDHSTMRIYFPLSDAIIDYNGETYEADINGLVFVDNQIQSRNNNSLLKVIGRKKSEDVFGTGTNIIEGNKIILDKNLTREISYKGASLNDAYVFDLGIREFGNHHSTDSEENINTRHGRKISCYDNHGGRNCSTAFGYNGKCNREYYGCMDYNGWFPRCNGSKVGYLGSDCFRAMIKGKCWNEL